MQNILLKIILIFLLVETFSLRSQTNLVPNPSFENYTNCPVTFGQIDYCSNWFSPNTGTPDYYNVCSVTSSGVNLPNSDLGLTTSNSGNAIGGFLAFDNPFSSMIFREYLGVRLSSSLINGKKYYFTYFIKLADSVKYASKSISAFFYIDIIGKSNYDTIKGTPQINNALGHITNKSIWQKNRGSFISNGTERYLYFGNFNYTVFNDSVFVGGGGSKPYFNSAYYYIDDVCLSDDSLYSENWYTSINEVENLYSKITIGPNPTNGEFKVENCGSCKILLYNSIGELINSVERDVFNDISHLMSGIYFLLIENENKKKYKLKLIKT